MIHQSDIVLQKHNEMRLKSSEKDFKSPLIMGILNVTPDSFSDGGNYFSKEKAVEHALEMFEQGADIVDIGGESTRPGSSSISLEEEKRRVIPVIEEIILKKPDAFISIDTTKSKVAEEAIKIKLHISIKYFFILITPSFFVALVI